MVAGTLPGQLQYVLNRFSIGTDVFLHSHRVAAHVQQGRTFLDHIDVFYISFRPQNRTTATFQDSTAWEIYSLTAIALQRSLVVRKNKQVPIGCEEGQSFRTEKAQRSDEILSTTTWTAWCVFLNILNKFAKTKDGQTVWGRLAGSHVNLTSLIMQLAYLSKHNAGSESRSLVAQEKLQDP